MCENKIRYAYYIDLYSGLGFHALEDEDPDTFLKHISEADDDSWYNFTAYDGEREEAPYFNVATRIGNIADIICENLVPADPRCDCGQPLDCPEDEYVE